MAAKVLTVAQQKGGAGKTTLVAQLGVAFAAAGRRVALIDIDPQKSLADWARIRGDNGVKAAHPVDVVEVAGYRAGNEVSRLSRSHDIIIIDSPPHAETEAWVAVRAADLVLVPVQPSPMDVWATKPTMDLARKAKVPALVVLNRVPPRGRVADAMRAKLADDGLETAAATVGNRVGFAASMLEGRTVIETARSTPAADEVRALADEVMSKL